MGGALQAAHGRLGMQLRRTRLKLGMTQMDVARAVGLDQTAVSAVERGIAGRESQDRVNAWLGNPEMVVEHVSDALLEAAVATGNVEKKRALVSVWMDLYGTERGENNGQAS